MTDTFDIVRTLNALLLISLIAGLVAGWWRARGEPLNPLGIATFTFAVALLYGTVEILLVNAGGGGRSFVVTVAILIANICVYVPLGHEIRQAKRKEKP